MYSMKLFRLYSIKEHTRGKKRQNNFSIYKKGVTERLTFNLNVVSVGKVHDVISNLTPHWYSLSISCDVSNIHPNSSNKKKGVKQREREKQFTITMCCVSCNSCEVRYIGRSCVLTVALSNLVCL